MSRPAYSRRQFLGLAVAGTASAALLACSAERATPGDASETPSSSGERTDAPGTASATVTSTPRPVPPAGREQRVLLEGTPWATSLFLVHSGHPGPRVMVLGGVHGNEPGGWLAAEELPGWPLRAGSLLVVPRANVLAINALERTLPELGDLNRSYPGSENGLPMARMAHAILQTAREFEADLLIDMHESWGFYAERTQNGTAFLGQTITAGQGPEERVLAKTLAAAVNDRLPSSERDWLIPRDTSSFPPPAAEGASSSATPAPTGRSTSSLAAGRYVSGLTPLLVETGQERQPVARRVELHHLVARTALELRGML